MAFNLLVRFDTIIHKNSDFVPISLLVTLEIVKFMQAIFIGFDKTIYDESKDMPTKVQSSNLNEELGQIEYIFSDKTGTLTQNIMEFKKMSIGNISYGLSGSSTKVQDQFDTESYTSEDTPRDSSIQELRKKASTNSSLKSIRDHDQDVTNVCFHDPTFYEHFENESHPNNENIKRFLLHLAICHTVIIEEKEADGRKKIVYSAR